MPTLKIKYLSILFLGSALNASSLLADVLLDPDNLGNRNISGTSSIVSPNIGSLFIGTSQGRGDVEVNANTNTLFNGRTELSASNIAIDFAGNGGSLRVIGNGVSGSASVSISGSQFSSIAVGSGRHDSSLEIRNGGVLTTNRFQIGGGGEIADSTVIVDGVGSRLDVTNGDLRSSGLAGAGKRTLTISNGATASAVTTVSASQFGSDLSNSLSDQFTATGSGSSISYERQFRISGGLDILNGASVSQIEAPNLIDTLESNGLSDSFTKNNIRGGAVRVSGSDTNGTASLLSVTRDINIEGSLIAESEDDFGDILTTPSSASLIVENGGVVQTTRNITVSADLVDAPNENGILTINSGGEVIANRVTLLEGGILNGDGGTLTSDLIVNGGVISPGNSPGILTIDGNLELLSGSLDFEIAGINSGEFDILNVTGDLIFGSEFDINISFINGFLPGNGDTFEFLQIAGDILGDLSLINLILNPSSADFDFNVDLNSGVFSIASNNSNLSSVPTPSTIILLVMGFISYRRLRR